MDRVDGSEIAGGTGQAVPRSRVLGPCLSPFNAFQFIQGIETLGMRMDRHVANALAVAKHLEGHRLAGWVKYPGLESNPYHALVERYMPKGAGAVFSFGVKGGYDAGKKFVDSLRVFWASAEFSSRLERGGTRSSKRTVPLGRPPVRIDGKETINHANRDTHSRRPTRLALRPL